MRPVILSLVLLAATPALAAPASTLEPSWLYGTWTAISDEDGTPADVMAFYPGGVHKNFGVGCNVNATMKYHVHDGDVYVTGELPKGPIALVFRPSADKKTMRYTSPRTRNNAIYAPLPTNQCEK